MLAANLSAQTADDRYPGVRDGKFGFIDASGKEVIPAQFRSVGQDEGSQIRVANAAERYSARGTGTIRKIAVGAPSVPRTLASMAK